MDGLPGPPKLGLFSDRVRPFFIFRDLTCHGARPGKVDEESHYNNTRDEEDKGNQVKGFFRGRRGRFITLFVLLLWPVFCFQNWKLKPAAPGARSGDEPHYLVLLFSLATDGDLLVKNNYANSDYSRGIYLSRYILEHHSNFIHRDTRRFYRWDEVYRYRAQESEPATAGKNPVALRLEKRAGFENFNENDYDEVGWHPPGYPILLLPFAIGPILADFYYYEALLILFQLALFTFAFLSFLESLERRGFIIKSGFALACALPAWYYNAAFYTEGIGASFVLLLFAAYLDRKLPLMSVYLGLLFFIKESYAPLVLLFMGAIFLEKGVSTRRKVGTILKLSIFPVLSLLLFIGRSLYLYGTPFQTYLPWQNNPATFQALQGLLFAPDGGILVFTPLTLLTIPGIFLTFFRGERKRTDLRQVAVLASGVFLFEFILTAMSIHWSGGPTFAYRILTPFIAPLFVGLIVLRDYIDTLKGFRRLSIQLLFNALLFVSVFNMFYGVTHLRSSYQGAAYINLFEPSQSRLYARIQNERK